MKEQEQFIIDAAKHVKMAQKQRELFVLKKEEAKWEAKNAQEERTYTFVANFAQNMYLPNFNAEQPGATYYYSPLNVYPLALYGSTDPSELMTFVYYKGKKAALLLMRII
jgi:hypothetical protein